MTDFVQVDFVEDAKARRKARQAFFTPLAVVDLLVRMADVWPEARVLEPSAGDGRIVHWLRQAGVRRVDACEIDPDLRRACTAHGATLVGEDFLAYRPTQRYHWIFMNPPFQRNADRKHVEHAYELLEPGGRIAAIMSFSSKDVLLDGLLSLPGCEYCSFEVLDKGTFKDSGTDVATLLVEIAKPGRRPAESVEGFRNGATFNAAMTITTDRAHYKASRALTTAEAFRQAFQRAVGELGGSTYGIDWQEVLEYVREQHAAAGAA